MNPSPYPEGVEPYVEFPEPVVQVDEQAFAEDQYRAYRAANRPYRRAFGGIYSGERDRKILLAVGQSTAQRKEAHS